MSKLYRKMSKKNLFKLKKVYSLDLKIAKVIKKELIIPNS